jgi:hypothetical protein
MGTTTAVIQHRGRQMHQQQQWSRRNKIGSLVPSVPTRPVPGPPWFCWGRDGRARPLGRGLHVAGGGSRWLTGQSCDALRGVSVRWRSRRGEGVRA